MGQSWERTWGSGPVLETPIAHLQDRPSLSASFPAHSKTPCEKASKVATSRLPSAPRCIPTPSFWRNPKQITWAPESWPSSALGESAWFSGQSLPGPRDSVPNHHSFPGELLTQATLLPVRTVCLPFYPSQLPPGSCKDQRLGPRYSESPCSQPGNPDLSHHWGSVQGGWVGAGVRRPSQD